MYKGWHSKPGIKPIKRKAEKLKISALLSAAAMVISVCGCELSYDGCTEKMSRLKPALRAPKRQISLKSTRLMSGAFLHILNFNGQHDILKKHDLLSFRL